MVTDGSYKENIMLGTIGDILVNSGVQLLGSTVKGTTELGLRKLGDFVKEKTGIDMFSEAIATNGLNSEQILTLKKLESDERVRIMEIDATYAKLSVADASSARNMQKAVINAEASWLAKHFIYMLAGTIILSTVIIQMYIVIHGVPEDSQRMVDSILSYLNNTSITIMGFFFGTKYNGSNNTQKMYTPPVDKQDLLKKQ